MVKMIAFGNEEHNGLENGSLGFIETLEISMSLKWLATYWGEGVIFYRSLSTYFLKATTQTYNLAHTLSINARIIHFNQFWHQRW